MSPPTIRALIALAVLWPAARSLRAQPQPAGFTPLPAPITVIGAEGDPDYEFIRILAPVLLPGGEIAVADQGTLTIRIFDPGGRLLRTLGRKGDGPGEFRAPGMLIASHDTLIVFDLTLRRLTRYLATGRLLDTQRVLPSPEDGTVYVQARLARGDWLVTTPHAPNWVHGHGPYRDTLGIGTLAAPATGRVRWTAHVPGMSFYAYMPGENKSQWAVGSLPFAPTAGVGVTADTIIVGDTGVPELRYLAADGRLIRRVTIPVGPAPDLSDHRRAALAEDLAEAQVRPRANLAYLRARHEVPRPPTHYRSFLVAADGSLWIRLHDELADGPSRYLVLDAAGMVKARVTLPPGGEVRSVQPPFAVATLRDQDDVLRVGVVRWTP